ncbi:alcohol dehydrogenase catalytic domain-containing protein [Treponema sp.]
MKQAVMTAPKTIEFRDVEVPEPKEGEVLVKVMAIGVCGSDVHVYHGLHPYVSYPLVQGHEVSCEVEKLGKNVSGFSKGDKVTIEPQVSCGTCYSCKHGLYNICDNLRVIGFQALGTASEYYAVSAKRLVKLPPSMTYNEGAMIEPLSVAVRAIKQSGDVRNKNVLVFGAGPIGNLVAQAAKAMGASKVMISDLNEFRLKKAKECGIEFTVNPVKQDLNAEVIEKFGASERADVIFECVGVNATMDAAIDVARKGTPIVVVGVFANKASLDMAKVNENELRLLGTARYVIADFETAKDLVASGAINLKSLVSNTFKFADYDAAYKIIHDKPEETMKVIVEIQK